MADFLDSLALELKKKRDRKKNKDIRETISSNRLRSNPIEHKI